MIRVIDAFGQLLQIIGILLSAPGEWIEYWGILLARRAHSMSSHNLDTGAE